VMRIKLAHACWQQQKQHDGLSTPVKTRHAHSIISYCAMHSRCVGCYKKTAHLCQLRVTLHGLMPMLRTVLLDCRATAGLPSCCFQPVGTGIATAIHSICNACVSLACRGRVSPHDLSARVLLHFHLLACCCAAC
jgi:hypothetical protein